MQLSNYHVKHSKYEHSESEVQFQLLLITPELFGLGGFALLIFIDTQCIWYHLSILYLDTNFYRACSPAYSQAHQWKLV